jgi:hypothetical protein
MMEAELSKLDRLRMLLAQDSESETACVAHQHVQGARSHLVAGLLEVEQLSR